ncbi:DUF6531 domain-containing protein [Nonomuraea typhae]|uniref:DUF6531 domain-containing protein n=1 Tax=Nonomuraea typhae TaxID=2603600 RepID=A0ABW7ZC09_9ACTN
MGAGVSTGRERVASGAGSERAAVGADPIHYATGTVILPHSDVGLPGPPGLALRRVHRSGTHAGRGFGAAWASTFDQRVEVHSDGLHVVAADGGVLVYPHPGNAPVGPCTGPGSELRRIARGYAVTDPATGLTARFRGTGDRLPLTELADAAGHRTELRHGPDGNPAEVRSAGVTVKVESAGGKVVAVRQGGRTLAAYAYDQAGNLTETTLPGGGRRYAYDPAGRVTRWEDADGVHLYTYDVFGRCVRAQGPDTDLTLEYECRGTSVRDGRGNHTVYLYDGLSQLVERIDYGYALDARAS